MPLNVLPIMTNSPSSRSRAPRWMFDNQPAAAPRPPLDAEDDEVEGVRRLDLLPRPSAPARRVGRVEGLDHRALVPGGQGVGDGLLAPRPTVGRTTPGMRWSATTSASTSPRARQRLVDEVDAVAVQAVEEPGLHGARRRTAFIVSWNGRGRPSSASGEGLAVEHDGLDGQGPGQRDDLGHAVGDLPQRPRPDPHLVAAPVHLDAGAVELVLDHDPGIPVGRAQLGQRRVQGVARARRASGAPGADLEADRAQVRRPSAPRAPWSGRRPESMNARRTASAGTSAAAATASIMRPSSAPWRSSPPSRRTRKRPSSSVAASSSAPSSAAPARADPRARAGHRGQPVEGGVDVADGEGGLRRPGSATPMQRAPADARAALEHLAREPRRRGPDLVGLQAAPAASASVAVLALRERVAATSAEAATTSAASSRHCGYWSTRVIDSTSRASSSCSWVSLPSAT